MARRRHLSRIAVMQVLFEREVRPEIDVDAGLKRNLEELGGGDDEFAQALLAGTLQNESELKDLIQKHAPGWSLDRMDPISRCVLQCSTFELTKSADAPVPVIINEAIEIAKEFGSDESGKFVNGVLNALAQEFRPKEARPAKPVEPEAPEQN
jgi:N utilization substance protein B